jgi:phosphoserine phosphatase
MRAAPTSRRLAVFDMDGTLLRGRLIFALAEQFGFLPLLDREVRRVQPPYERTRRIARLLRGLTPNALLETLKAIPLAAGARPTIGTLRRWQFAVGIISDSYTQVTEQLRRALRLDFSVANELLAADGRLTGEVRMPDGGKDCPWRCGLSVCKASHLRWQAQHLGIPLSATVAIGDTAADACMLEQASLGIAFDPKDMKVQRHADVIIRGHDLRAILPYCRGVTPSAYP